jgi:hypothetical protein
MSSTPPSGVPADGGPVSPRRRWVVASAVAAALVAALVVLGVVLGGDDDATAAGGPAAETSAAEGSPAAPAGVSAPAGDPSGTATPSGAPTGTPAAEEGDPNAAPPSLPAVALDASVPVEGVTASLAQIESIEGTATGPGNVNGPALRVSVRLQNGTGADLDLDGVAVDLATGRDLTPASPLDDPSQSLFSGTVPAGEAVEGVYVFSVPVDDQDDVTIGVGFTAGAPIAVFSGSPS